MKKNTPKKSLRRFRFFSGQVVKPRDMNRVLERIEVFEDLVLEAARRMIVHMQEKLRSEEPPAIKVKTRRPRKKVRS